MVTDCQEQNAVTSDAYDVKYKKGYGLQYPDGHVIRFYHHILEHELKLKEGLVLDYGCGNGVHLQYFQEKGFIPYGCDTSETAIAQCKKRLPKYSDHFQVISTLPTLSHHFSGQFDLIFSNQVLYFFNDTDLSHMLKQFHAMLKSGGIFFATMMGPNNYYSRYITGQENGMSKVVLTDRLKETNFINFKTKEQVNEIFSQHGFKKLHLGWYSCVIREDEGASDHWMFVGQKA